MRSGNVSIAALFSDGKNLFNGSKIYELQEII